MMFKWEELKAATGAALLKNKIEKDQAFDISTDTRTIKSGDIYLPLKGASFDGENFIDKAVENGAIGYFTTSGTILDKAQIVFQVNDNLEAYLNIAKYYREKINPITVAITGSSGKTTTKELVYSVLSQKYNTQKTFSNHNNEIGFCQTVLGMTEDTQALIVEMGMRGLGEIELISTHLNPDYAIITNCGTAHIGRLGSTENIAKAKCEITTGLKKDGVFIALNQEIIKKHNKFEGEKIYYTLDDVEILKKAPSYSMFKYKNELYELNVEGDYNIENSLAAIELGKNLGLTYEEIKKGLQEYQPIEKRWEIEEINGFKFINDSYNANPESMKASVKTFVELYKNPVVVLGDMGELGENERNYHRQVGEFLAALGNKKVKYILVGNLSKEIGKPLEKKDLYVHYCNSNSEASRYILDNLNNSYTIFLKASRAMKFEEILENIKRGIYKL